MACEGDVDGALTMLCCKFLGCGAPYISDWLEHDRSSFVCWHGGMCPTCLTSDTGDGGGPVSGLISTTRSRPWWTPVWKSTQ